MLWLEPSRAAKDSTCGEGGRSSPGGLDEGRQDGLIDSVSVSEPRTCLLTLDQISF